MKLCTFTDWGMQNSVLMSTFSIFDWNCLFCINLVLKIKCLLKLKFDTYTNSNMQNSVVVFTFSALDLKYLFCTNVVQKIEIVNLSWKIVRRLIRIWRVQWWCSFFSFQLKVSFFGKFPKKPFFAEAESLNLDEFECVKFDDDFYFLFLHWEYFFCIIWTIKSKLSV